MLLRSCPQTRLETHEKRFSTVGQHMNQGRKHTHSLQQQDGHGRETHCLTAAGATHFATTAAVAPASKWRRAFSAPDRSLCAFCCFGGVLSDCLEGILPVRSLRGTGRGPSCTATEAVARGFELACSIEGALALEVSAFPVPWPRCSKGPLASCLRCSLDPGTGRCAELPVLGGSSSCSQGPLGSFLERSWAHRASRTSFCSASASCCCHWASMAEAAE